MSSFKCPILPIKIEAHPDPEVTAIEIGKIGDFNVVVKKGQFHTGQMVCYIPEGSILPDSLIKELGLEGKLAGSAKNRVKPIRLRGVMSQGLVYIPSGPPDYYPLLKEEMDLSYLLGITKYEPPIPVSLAGQMQIHPRLSLKFDIENIKRYPNTFQEGEEVVYTEKVHGTFVMMGLVHEDDRVSDMVEGKFFISSKGLGASGLYIKDTEENKNNTYLKAFRNYGLSEKIENIRNHFINKSPYQSADIHNNKDVVWLLGEVFGVQKGYGYGANGNAPGFRAFAIKVGDLYLPTRDYFEYLCNANNIEFTPVLYRGPFSKETLSQYTDGLETITGKNIHIREGIVVTPVQERYDSHIRRAMLKSVSDAYLKKSDGEEFN